MSGWKWRLLLIIDIPFKKSVNELKYSQLKSGNSQLESPHEPWNDSRGIQTIHVSLCN